MVFLFIGIGIFVSSIVVDKLPDLVVFLVSNRLGDDLLDLLDVTLLETFTFLDDSRDFSETFFWRSTIGSVLLIFFLNLFIVVRHDMLATILCSLVLGELLGSGFVRFTAIRK